MNESQETESKGYKPIVINLLVALVALVLQSYVHHWNFAEGIGFVLGGYFWGWLIFLVIKLIVRDVKTYDKYRKRRLYLGTVNWVLIIGFAGGLVQNG